MKRMPVASFFLFYVYICESIANDTNNWEKMDIYKTDNRITERTLLVTTPELEEMGVYFLSEKEVFRPYDDNGHTYMELGSMWISDTRKFTDPKHEGKVNTLMKKLQRDKVIRMRHNYIIRSLHGHDLLVTVKKDGSYRELECRRYRPGTVYVTETCVSTLNDINCKILNLHKDSSSVRPNPGIPYQEVPIHITPNIQVHTVEVKGHQRYPEPERVTNGNREGNWTPPGSLTTDTFEFHYDYEEKKIWTACEMEVYTGHTRRSGWETEKEYIYHHAKGIRYFDSRFEMSRFVHPPFIGLYEKKFIHKGYEVFPESESRGRIRIKYFKPESYMSLYEAMGMKVTGAYYYDWE